MKILKDLKKWWFDQRVGKALAEVRQEIQEIWDTAERRRHPFGARLKHINGYWATSTHDLNLNIEEYMKPFEKKKYEELCTTEFYFSKHLGVKPEWGHEKYLSSNDNSPPAFMRVTEDRSTKLTYEFDEVLDGYVPYRNGVREPTFYLRKVVKDGQPVLGEDGEQLTEEIPRGFEPREAFEKNWKKHPDFDRLYKEWMENTNGIG